MNWQTALGLAAALFGVFIVFRFRPVFPGGESSAKREALRLLRKQILSEQDGEKKAELLCAAAKLCLEAPGLKRRARRYAFRAVALAPRSTSVFAKASDHLADSPRALEKACWRVLGECANESHHPNFREAIRKLGVAYELRRDVRKSAAMKAIFAELQPAAG